MEWEAICRVCLQGGREAELVSLFDTDESNEPLKDKYLYCSDIMVEEMEPLPSNICLTCVDRLLSAYQFKRQCITSHDTLKACLSEFKISGADSEPFPKLAGVELVAIEEEDGEIVQYEIPVEVESDSSWPNKSRRQKKNFAKETRGRPRKYPNSLGYIEKSPYCRKSSSTNNNLTQVKTEPNKESEESVDINDKNISSSARDIELNNTGRDNSEDLEKEVEVSESDGVLQLTLDSSNGSFLHIIKKPLSKEASVSKDLPKKAFDLKLDDELEKEEDILLQETILANSEPIPEDLLNSQSKEKKKSNKRVYKYDKVHTCDQCGSSFRSNASLQAHIRRHLGIKPFVCTLCGYASVLNMELRRHMKRHTGLKPYKCRFCGRFFSDFGSRQKHERLHLGERPYGCNICGKTFTYSYVLSNHMLTHTGEKKFSCVPCCKKFTKAHHLKHHNKIHHKDLYMQQQLIDEEKKKMQQFNMSNLVSACNEELVELNQNSIQIQHVQTVPELAIKEDIHIIPYTDGNVKCEPMSEIKIEDELL